MKTTACLVPMPDPDRHWLPASNSADHRSSQERGFCNPRRLAGPPRFRTTRSPEFPNISRHAAVRMQQGRISKGDIQTAMRYGHLYHARNAAIYIVGRREIRKYDGVPAMTLALNGLHVICSTDARHVITVYRNPTFKRSSFDSKRREKKPPHNRGRFSR
jgi:hypothetical protein